MHRITILLLSSLFLFHFFGLLCFIVLLVHGNPQKGVTETYFYILIKMFPEQTNFRSEKKFAISM